MGKNSERYKNLNLPDFDNYHLDSKIIFTIFSKIQNFPVDVPGVFSQVRSEFHVSWNSWVPLACFQLKTDYENRKFDL